MTTLDDLRAFPYLPADQVAFGGAQLDVLKTTGRFERVVRDGIVTTTPPPFARGRAADAWLVGGDYATACALLWSEERGEFVVTVVVEDSHRPPAILRLHDVPAHGAVPLAGRRVDFSRHASRLWAEQLPDRDLNRLLAADDALVTRKRPPWIRRRDNESAFLVLSHGRIITPLRSGGPTHPAVATGLFLASAVNV